MPSPQVGVGVSLVAVQFGGLTPTWSAAGAHGGYAAHERLKGLTAVEINTGDSDGEGQTGPVRDQMDLRTFLASVHRIRARQVPPSEPACSPSRSRSATSPVPHGGRVRPGPAGAA